MTDIEWSDESWNPIRARLRSDPSVIGWHCEHASPGCENCYSETRNRSGRCNMGTKLTFKPGHRKDVDIYIDEAQLLKPLGWKKGKKIFVCSMSDLFADFVTDEMLDRIFAVMILSHQHTFQVLTKRSARMREYFLNKWPMNAGNLDYRYGCVLLAAKALGHDEIPLNGWPLPNVWLGVSVEDQQRADERIPDLLATPAAVRWISAEPLLGPVNLEAVANDSGFGDVTNIEALSGKHHFHELGARSRWVFGAKLDWVVVGGESGPGARPMHPDWARSLRDQCAAADVPFFFKQWGEWQVSVDRERDDPHWRLDYGTFYANCGNTRWLNLEGGCGFHGERFVVLQRVGKKSAGRLLDGVEHNGMPGQA